MNAAYLRRSVFRILKKNKWIFYYYEKAKWHKEIEYHKQTNDPKNLKPIDQIKREEKAIRDYWRIGTFHYYRYGLQYKQLSEEQLLDYVPTFYFHKSIEHHHKGVDTILYGDKLTQALLFEERNIPTAQVIAVVKKGECLDLLGKINVDLAQIVREKLVNTTNKLFFKPSGNCGGAGILVLKCDDEGLLLNNERISSLEDLWSSLIYDETYVVEENIIQSTQLSQINSSSVNTLRTVVQRGEDRMVIKTCILRMGRNGKEVDNSAQGGISIGVDVSSGQLADYATAEHGSGVFYEHPDSKFQFAGSCIDNWEDVKCQIESIANKLIDFKDIALDIAITNDKVILVEFNFRYGIEHQQCVLGGMRRTFNISNK